MASLQAKTDAVKAAVASTSSCTPATVVTLKELLAQEQDASASKPIPASRGTKTPVGSRTKANGGVKKAGSSPGDDELLSARERTVLATHVINAAIKSLSEAAKPPPLATPAKRSDDAPRPTSKRTLRRSLSAPISPLQPRTLNRVATSPIVTSKSAKLLQPSQSTGCLATAECARVAFACLRTAKGPVDPDQTDFQLETGMSALVGKLLALKMHEQALKELKLLKRRLETTPTAETAPKNKPLPKENTETASNFAELLNFSSPLAKPRLSIATTCQIQLLKLVATTKKPAHIEAVLPILDDSHDSSPINLLSQLGQVGEKEAALAARQMASLSQILLSLAPSVSSQEDASATESRLSPSPMAAFQLQTLAFRTQLKWWKLAGHQGNVDNDVLSPFSRCVRAFARRHGPDDAAAYTATSAAFDSIMKLIPSQKNQPSSSSKSPLFSIYQLLGTTAQTARRYDDARRWLLMVKASLNSELDTPVRMCSVSARLLAVTFKGADLSSDIELLLHEVIEGLDGSLSGTVADLNDLLESLSLARRSIVGVLMDISNPATSSMSISAALGELLKTFIRRYPRFVRRWLGTSPGKDASPKQLLQFDQRRQLVTQSINQILDATLMIVKGDIQSASVEWQTMDDILQHSVSLLDSVADPALSASRIEQLGNYHVKISSLYFSRFSQLRKETNRSKDTNKQLLQALNRSIDTVKECSTAEKEKAQLSTKLEIFADLCKGAGRAEDAVKTLRSVCTNMAEEGVLSVVGSSLSSNPPSLAWAANEKTTTLSRTLRSIAKLDKSWNDWTFFLPETERAAVLEHLMYVSSESSSAARPLQLHDSSVTALLRIYSIEKYPVRRLRVLLHLFCQNIGEEDEVKSIRDLAEEALRQTQRKDKAEDSSLSAYIPHLQAYFTSISALAKDDSDFPVSAVKDAISSWKTMAANCVTRSDVYKVIDDPENLLQHLQSLNHLAGLKGESHLQLSILDLAITIAKAFGESSGSASDDLIVYHSRLATRYVGIGMFDQAVKILEQAEKLIDNHDGFSRGAVAEFYLSQAEYYAGVGNTDEATNYISKANCICNEPYSSWAQSKSQATITLAVASFLRSTVAIQSGDIEDALSSIKSSVRMLSHDWSKLETPASKSSVGADTSLTASRIENDLLKPSQTRLVGSRFWNLASPLLRCLLHISSVYAHIGMFQETIYYAESAWKIAESTQSSLYLAQVAAWTGSVYLKAGKADKALSICHEAEKRIPQEISSFRVQFASQLGDIYWELGDNEKAQEYLKIAEDTAHLLGRASEPANVVEKSAEPKSAAKTIGKPAVKAPRVTRGTRAKTPVASSAVSAKKGVAAKVKTQVIEGVPSLPKDVYQSSLLAAIILSRSLGFIHQKDWSSALTTLEQAKNLPKLLGTLPQEQVIMATTLIGHSMEQMISDPVFSVMQDSTISLPAIAGSSEKSSPERQSLSVSPPRKGRGAAVDRKNAKERGLPAFADALKQAQELLMEAHASAMSCSDSNMVHRISALLQSTIILLSATSATKSKAAIHSGLATVAVDLARNVTWRREQKTLDSATQPTAVEGRSAGLASSTTSRRSSMGLTADMAKFQKNYVDMVPKAWSVVSISLSDNRHDLCVTKFQAGHSPFILRLPLERANSRDADSEVFNFEHGREELLEIINLANETSHSARDFTAKGERSVWWAEREELDTRLKDLLLTIETTWLGGFKGIFSQHRHRSDLLARFQKNFHQILDGSLPSRSRLRGKKTSKAPTVTLDPRILDLFIGLGDPTDPDGDYDEALNDLLYFVVDILQFHGERNAYDEIDFDAMVVETYDALRGYYDAAAKCGAEKEEDAHTVLVLDKALHNFPWESLPCMGGLSVSRVPSLACLRQLITDAQPPREANSSEGGKLKPLPEGHYVSAKSGTYILNPSSDLKNTQSFFQPSFSSLQSWTSIVNRVPEEADFEQALSTSEVVLYFGHGSGAQYVRGKTIRRLDKCKPATFLMGCSSAALTEAGGFECYGPVWNYMMAGCPAVVGTLWDVTDRDIDRFAGRAFEEWGLFPRGTFKDDKKGGNVASRRGGRADDAAAADDDEASNVSLPAAVAKARNVCRFKYLNAAAVVVYGIPVYIKRDDE